jgi:hypothetical protein
MTIELKCCVSSPSNSRPRAESSHRVLPYAATIVPCPSMPAGSRRRLTARIASRCAGAYWVTAGEPSASRPRHAENAPISTAPRKFRNQVRRPQRVPGSLNTFT